MPTRPTAVSDPREVRQAVGVSLARAAVMADVSEPTARVYELSRDAIQSQQKREALDNVYAGFRELSRRKRG